MTIDWSGFDKVIYINQKERNNRKHNIEKELYSLSIPPKKIYRLDAKPHLIGHIGRAQSHLKAIETAIVHSWGNVLILEDDMVFNKDPASIERLNKFLQTLHCINWHCALFSAVYQKVITLKSTDCIVKPLEAFSACAYAIHSDYRATIRECFAGSVEKLRQGGNEEAYSVDAAWLPFMKSHSWIGMYPVAGHQALDKSDIKNDMVDNTMNFYKPLTAIAL